MNNYEISKQDKGFIMPFATEQAATDWADSYFVDGYTIADLGPVIEPTESEKLAARQTFGKELLNEYLIDNDLISKAWGRPFTPTETAQQAGKFLVIANGVVVTTIQELLTLGSLTQALAIMQNIVVDDIFTQERKDKYINKLSQFLNL